MGESNEPTLLDKVKNSLSIVTTSTMKDIELNIWIESAKEDLKRQAVDVDNLIDNELIIGAIVMYVKAHFGMCDINEKKLALQTYIDICHNLPLSSEYLGVESLDADLTLIAMDNEGE